MSWAEHHRFSEAAALAAHEHLRLGRTELARMGFASAAESEEQALRLVNPHEKARTYSITAVSAVALWYKAGDLARAEALAAEVKNVTALAAFARREIEGILVRIENERAAARAELADIYSIGLARESGVFALGVSEAAGNLALETGGGQSRFAERMALLRHPLSDDRRAIHASPRNPGISTRLPMSPVQKWFWWLDQPDRAAGRFHTPIGIRLQGSLDAAVLQAALDAIVQRHEALRTTFVSLAGEPEQVIAPSGHVSMRIVDVSELTREQRDAQVQLEKREEAHLRFDLSVGPVVRARLLRLQSDEHVLLITLHDIAADYWSTGIFTRELIEFYSAAIERRSSRLPPLSIHYADYAQWQRAHLEGQFSERLLAYWKEQLEGASLQLGLPADRAPSSVRSYRSSHVDVALDSGLVTRVGELARRHNVTVFMILYGAWAIQLSRVSGRADVSIGTTIAGRNQREVEDVIGPFADMLVLRVEANRDLSVLEFLQRVKDTTLGAYANQHMPLAHLIETLRPDRALSINPLFHTSLTLNGSLRREFSLPGLNISIEESVDESSTFDLALSLTEHDGKMTGVMSYAADLFDRRTVERWAASFLVLIDEMVEHSDRCLGELRISAPEEPRPSSESTSAAVVSGRAFQPPEGEIEQALAAIWRQILDVNQIDRRDNFFELGGHSLTATKMVVRVAEALRVGLPLVAIFQHPTLQELASAVAVARASQTDEVSGQLQEPKIKRD